jgi:hypothetical protein
LTIANNASGTANSAHYNTTQTIGGAGFNGFIATFNYTVTASGGPAPADGFSFVIQNSGINAIGGSGSDLGYAGIGNSASVQFNIWPFNGGGVGTNYFTEGNVGSSQNPSYLDVSPVDLASGDQIALTLEYNPLTNRLSEQLVQRQTRCAG